jgi:6-phosphogluconolactonase
VNDKTIEPVFVELPDKEAVSRAAAQRFVALAGQYTQTETFTVALSGGSTPRRLFQLLANAPFRDQVPWTQVHLFWGDERCVPPDHADSNYRMTREALLDHIDIPPQNVHRVRGELDPPQAAKDYRNQLENLLRTNPRFDLVLLGMGSDGHTASLFPSSPALDEREQTAIAVYAAHLGSWRVTLTLPILNRTQHVLFLVTGASKAPALARIRAGEPLPAGQVCPSHGTLTWLLDRDAAEGLQD